MLTTVYITFLSVLIVFYVASFCMLTFQESFSSVLLNKTKKLLILTDGPVKQWKRNKINLVLCLHNLEDPNHPCRIHFPNRELPLLYEFDVCGKIKYLKQNPNISIDNFLNPRFL